MRTPLLPGSLRKGSVLIPEVPGILDNRSLVAPHLHALIALLKLHARIMQHALEEKKYVAFFNAMVHS